MSVLILDSVSYSIAGLGLLERASLMVDPGRRIGLIGRNGAGKSTLLKLIARELQVDGGTIRLGQRVRLGYVAQEAPGGDTRRGSGAEGRCGAHRALLAEAEDETVAHDRIAEIHDRLLTIGADVAPARAAAILSGLGVLDRVAGPADEQLFRRLADACRAGGGVVLSTLICSCSMSRPTIWIWKRRSGWNRIQGISPGAVLLVSHDRQLLDRAVEAIAQSGWRQADAHAGRLCRIYPDQDGKGAATGPRRRAGG